jgi:CRISPR-associated protein Csx14
MTPAEIPVDLLNPGQVFACVGLMEAVEKILCKPCEGGFVYNGSHTDARFQIQVDDEAHPVRHILEFLARAKAIPKAPYAYAWNEKSWGTKPEESKIYPAPAPDTPASLAIVLRADSREVPIEHWLDGSHNGRDNVKFWAGSGGYPGAALARDALALLAPLGGNAIADIAADPFAFAAPMSSSFRFDWRRDYVPLDAGFSLNAHTNMTTVGYPLVELLAAIGLQNARPERPDRRDKLAYRYGVTNAILPTILVRAVLGGAKIGFPIRIFRMRLDWPGQEGQARCMVDAREEESAQ